MLISEHQIKRENIKIIGIECAGTKINGKPRLTCSFCQERTPVDYDVLIESDIPIEIPTEAEAMRTFRKWKNGPQKSAWRIGQRSLITAYVATLAVKHAQAATALNVSPSKWTRIGPL